MGRIQINIVITISFTDFFTSANIDINKDIYLFLYKTSSCRFFFFFFFFFFLAATAFFFFFCLRSLSLSFCFPSFFLRFRFHV